MKTISLLLLSLLLANSLSATSPDIEVSHAKFNFIQSDASSSLTISSDKASEILVFSSDQGSTELYVDIFDIPAGVKREIKVEQNPLALETIRFVQLGSKLRAILSFNRPLGDFYWESEKHKAHIHLDKKEFDGIDSDSTANTSLPAPAVDKQETPESDRTLTFFSDKPDSELVSGLLDGLKANRVAPDQLPAESSESLTEPTAPEDSKQHQNLLVSVGFEKNKQQKTMLRLVLSESASFKLSKITKDLYRLYLNDFAILDHRTKLPFFAPQDFAGVKAVQARETTEGVVVDIYTEENARIAPFSRGEVIFLTLS